MKKVISIMAAVFTLAAAVPFTAAAEETFSLGDVNMSGKVDAVDASAILGAYAVKATGGDLPFDDTCAVLADTNKDGLVDSKDASLVLAYYAYNATGGTVSPEEYYVNPPVHVIPNPPSEPNMPANTGRYYSPLSERYLYCWNDITRKAWKKDDDKWVEFEYFDYDAFLYAVEREEEGGGTCYGPCVGYGFYMGRDGKAMFIPSWDPGFGDSEEYYGVAYYNKDDGYYHSGLIFNGHYPWT